MEHIDHWSSDDFEDTVASTLIAYFETKVKKQKGAPPSDRLTEDRIALIRNTVPYIPSSSRYVDATETEAGNPVFDVVNDALPTHGCFAFRPSPGTPSAIEFPSSYLFIMHFRMVSQLGLYWQRRGPGQLYELYTVNVDNDGIDGERRYFTVSKDGEVISCSQKLPTSRGYRPGRPVDFAEHDSNWLKETSSWGAFSLQFIADKRFCWTIRAEEKLAKAELGCMKEEIKSLLYARSLPMTDTGRKRPILHLVEAHKRRMRNGTDIDITTFLRGSQTVEMGGTLFTVKPPSILQPNVSKHSQERYF